MWLGVGSKDVVFQELSAARGKDRNSISISLDFSFLVYLFHSMIYNWISVTTQIGTNNNNIKYTSATEFLSGYLAKLRGGRA